MTSWFGICRIGSFYCLAYSLEYGPRADLLPLVTLALAAMTASVVVHGISATPLMKWYRRLRGALIIDASTFGSIHTDRKRQIWSD